MRPPIRALRHHLLPCLVLLASALAVTSARPAYAAGNLLAGRSPSRRFGVSNVGVLTDGISGFEGEEWNTTVAAVFESDRAFVEFDLGRSTKISAAYLQGDNNDDYVLSISEDDSTFVPLWTATSRSEAGLRDRWSDGLSGYGRWIRVGVRGGDQAYSVSELQLFEVRPPTMPPPLRRVPGESQAARLRTRLLFLVAAFGAFLFLSRATAKPWQLLVAAILPLLAAGLALGAVEGGWPLAGREVSFIRAAAAAIALLAAVRGAVLVRRWPAHRWAITAALTTSAVMAFASFYNLGRPQFFDHAGDRPEFVHTYDMRVYQPFAKYFEELQYDGVYMASVLAYAEDQRDGSLASLAPQEVRSLLDHRMRHVGELTEDIQTIRRRFSDERWAELKKDLRYFEGVMGPEFLSTLTDHGANATPVWVFFARLLFAHAPASEGLLVFGGLIDGMLLVLLALVLWRSFGLGPMLLAMTVFGATDLYMFGTNWTGATLRHDWLVLLGFGACALKKERWVAAGVCLGLSAMIRAFPGVALVGVALPALWAIGERWRRDRRPPPWRRVLEEHAGTARVLGSAAACMIGMFLLTGFLYSFGAWVNWWHKVTLLNRDVGVNEVSLRALIAGVDASSVTALQERMILFVAAEIGSIACIAVLARRRPLYQAMLIAMPLVLVVSNPSNYYSHFIFLLALLASVGPWERAAGRSESAESASSAGEASTSFEAVPLEVPFHRVAAPLLALCIAGYWASLDPDAERHFQDSTALLFVSLGWLYANLLRAVPAAKVAPPAEILAASADPDIANMTPTSR
jgi:hypothetical protein